jgi:hypothetical protein
MDTIYCDQTKKSNISYQLQYAIDGPFLVGHDYLFYVKLVKGYQVIELNPPVNVTRYTFLSYEQSATGGRIAQYMVKQFNNYTAGSYYANVDMVWDGTQWTNLVSDKVNPTTNNKFYYSASYARLITGTFTSSIDEAVNMTVQYLYPGQFNLTAVALETGQTDIVEVNVTLSKKTFLLYISRETLIKN